MFLSYIKYLFTSVLLFCLLFFTSSSKALDTLTVCEQPGMNVAFLECAALVNLYNITDGDNWANNSAWGTANAVSYTHLTLPTICSV